MTHGSLVLISSRSVLKADRIPRSHPINTHSVILLQNVLYVWDSVCLTTLNLKSHFFSGKESLFQEHRDRLSTAIYQVLEAAGINNEITNLRRDRWLEFEILKTLTERLKHSERSFYVFGSQIEGTTLPDLLSDTDILISYDKIPVVETIENVPEKGDSYLICRDEHTPAGYVRLQKWENGKPSLDGRLHSVEGNRVFVNNKVIKRRLMKYGKPLKASDKHISGPAVTLPSSVHGEIHDIVGAYRCKEWPQFAKSWFDRPRLHNWPSSEVLDECKHLGCFVVPVGHPFSPGQDMEWRVSFSLQERLLVFNFSPVQLKCYVLLKTIKQEFIAKRIKEKSLTSYHLKTCLFYLFEETDHGFWNANNILKCIQLCLEQLLKWITASFCPNYFIPEENMFDRHVKGTVREELKCCLQNLLYNNFNYICNIETGSIGASLSGSHPLRSPPDRNILLNEITKYKIQCKGLEYRISESNRLLRMAENKCIPGLSRFISYLEEIIVKLAHINTITEHTEEQTVKVKKRILPYLNLSQTCNQMAELSKTENAADVKHWNDLKSKDDFMSSTLKRVVCLYTLNELKPCLQILNELKQDTRTLMVNVCSCSAQQKCKILVAKLNNGTLSKNELEKVCFAPCVSFLPTEVKLVPYPLRFEMTRTFGMYPCLTGEKHAFWFKWAVIDGTFLLELMLFLTASSLGMPEKINEAIQNMEHVIGKDPDLGHKETCLNVLSWVYKRQGLKMKALNCLRQSVTIRQRFNAAFVHIMCLVAEQI